MPSELATYSQLTSALCSYSLDTEATTGKVVETAAAGEATAEAGATIRGMAVTDSKAEEATTTLESVGEVSSSLAC